MKIICTKASTFANHNLNKKFAKVFAFLKPKLDRNYKKMSYCTTKDIENNSKKSTDKQMHTHIPF